MGVPLLRRFVALALAGTNLTTAAAWGQSKLDDRVGQILSEIGSVRVLVVMTAPQLGETTPSAAHREPAGFVAGILGERGQNVRRIVDLPIVVAETDQTGIAGLVDSPHVAYVIADEPVPPLLEASLQTLRVDDLHAASVVGGGHAVAVLDTGVNYDHPFFNRKLLAEGCFSTPQSTVYSVRSLCRNGLDVDLTAGAGRNCALPVCEHGTHVAGIAVGAKVVLPGGREISGVAPRSDLISIQVFTEFDEPNECRTDAVPCVRSFPSDQLRALRHVRGLLNSHDVASVNMSLGDGYHDAECDSPLKDEILRLRDSGVLTVVASGNDGYYNAVNTPACISAAITVGASYKDRIELDSSYSNTSALVDFLAPGTGIVSSTSAGGYGPKSGTSFAAPHVAGLIALLRSQAASASADAVEFAVRSTAQRTTDPWTGLPLYFPDAEAALRALVSSGLPMGSSSLSPLRGDVASFGGLVGARRVIVQGAPNRTGLDETVALIGRLLGQETVVRALDESTYVAENRAGFSAESLSRLIGALGADTRLYADQPVAPNTLR